MSSQTDPGLYQHKDGVERPMEVTEGIPFRSDLNSLLVNEVNHIAVTQMKEAMILGIEEALAEALELGFRTANTDIKIAFLAFRGWFYLK